MRQSDIVFCQAAGCSLTAANIFQLRVLEAAPESIVFGIAVQH
jgi:hypothetical protein